MYPWKRPAPHGTFKAESDDLLAALRVDVASNHNRANHTHFKLRSLWTYSWERAGQPTGIHKTALVGPSHWTAKCAWCEQLRERKRELDVEHYRPKVCVTEWSGAPAIVSDAPPPEVNERGGYWWLAFSWSNFSLACKTCNQGWKRNLFPVRSPRVADVKEGDELADGALLLDPSAPFRVRDHFRWTPGGIIEPVSDEGRATIITCGLNRRELLERRGQVAQNVLAHRGQFLQAIRRRDATRSKSEKTELAALGAITAEFTGMVRWLVEEGVGRAWEELGLTP
ncbi:MAG: hypothetical protein U0326_08765 [Polyangiales bacterium]